ncbi:septum formation initiator family protein [Balneolaceae bacterium YR4-1]|uniref:Septum formation initiator family protein n=1 Tax=Halalkalibaculum roseum TaxID=2709311 RepID=A0A6M1SQF1_9BACT|nr:septum formation initiator family protein [Halalkalibaculum roseum]NGP77601.1 septum formation initiator family protein [Halalkalibaculum roseum]
MNFQIFNPLRWRKSFLMLILGGFLFIWFAFIDTYSLWTRYDLSQRKDELKVKTEQLEAETARLKQQIEDLKNDPALLERIAREEYGMKKEGETVYKIKVEK